MPDARGPATASAKAATAAMRSVHRATFAAASNRTAPVSRPRRSPRATSTDTGANIGSTWQ